MGIGMGFGYGAAQALSEIPGAALRGRRAAEASAMKEREMQIAEAGSRRSQSLADESIATSSQARKKELAGAEAEMFDGAPVEGETKPVAPDAQVAASSAPAIEAKGAAPAQQDVEAHGMGYPTTSKGKPADALPSAAGLSVKDISAVRQGKAAISRTEGADMLDRSNQLRSQAEAAAGRLPKVMAVIDSQHGGDSVFATFLKADVKHKIQSQVTAMRQESAKLAQEAKMADFAQKGATFAEGLLGYMAKNPGKKIDDAWIKEHKQEADDLGVDPSMLYGLHQSPTDGNIKNAQGTFFPRESLMRMANPSLPWLERIKGAAELDKSFKMQRELSLEAARIQKQDPWALIEWKAGKSADLRKRYEVVDGDFQNVLSRSVKGGDIKVNGKVYSVTPGLVKLDGDWGRALETSSNPGDAAFYRDVLLPLMNERRNIDILDSQVVDISRGGVGSDPYRRQERLSPIRVGEAEQKESNKFNINNPNRQTKDE